MVGLLGIDAQIDRLPHAERESSLKHHVAVRPLEKGEEAILLANVGAEILGDRAVGVFAAGAAGGVGVVRSRPADERWQFRLVLVDRMVPRHKHGLGGGGAAHRKPHEREEGKRGDDCDPLPKS